MLTSSIPGQYPESPGPDNNEASISISVAMATYNGEQFIRQQLDSLAAQTFLPIELVVTDDGSTDSTLAVVEAFAKTAPFEVKIHRNGARLGFANNFLKCAGLCAGEVVAFCDQDDIWLDRKLQRCKDAFIDRDVLLCLHNAKVWTRDEQGNRHWPAFKTSSVLPPGTIDPLLVFPGFSMLIRKQILSVLDPSDRPANIHSLSSKPHPMSHDQWVWFIAAIFGKIACIAETLAWYRQHQGNTYGAGPNRGVTGALLLSMNNLSYALQAQLSNECATFLDDAMTALPDDLQVRAARAIQRFSRRGNWQTMRARLYGNASPVRARVSTFLQILTSGGYTPDRTKTSLGVKAAAKDLIFGVPGLYRMLPFGLSRKV